MTQKQYDPLPPVSNCPICGSGAKMYEFSMGHKWVRCSNYKGDKKKQLEPCGISMPYNQISAEECKARWERRV